MRLPARDRIEIFRSRLHFIARVLSSKAVLIRYTRAHACVYVCVRVCVVHNVNNVMYMLCVGIIDRRTQFQYYIIIIIIIHIS